MAGQTNHFDNNKQRNNPEKDCNKVLMVTPNCEESGSWRLEPEWFSPLEKLRRALAWGFRQCFRKYTRWIDFRKSLQCRNTCN